jgi:hypothetical protein
MVRSTGFPPATIELVTVRSSGNCEVLATGCTLLVEQYHHRRPRGSGGTRRPETNQASNCLAVCRRCHERCESMRNWARENGFLVAQHQDPKLVPVWWRCAIGAYDNKRFVLLADNGDRQSIPVRRAV